MKKKIETEQGDKTKSLQCAIDYITKTFGKGSILNGLDKVDPSECLPTNIFSLDRALGGGFGKGRISEIFGPAASGKTSIALQLIANTQKNNGLCAFIDAEHELNQSLAQNMGVDMNKLLISQPTSAEETLQIARTLCTSGALDLIVVDSVAAMVPQTELEGLVGDQKMASVARLMSQFLRQVKGIASKTGTHLLMINQIRMKIGVMFGSPEVTSGGEALKFYAAQRIRISSKKMKNEGGEIPGQTAHIVVVKNKLCAPFKEADIVLEYGKGFNEVRDLITVASQVGIIKKSGAWLNYKDVRLGCGLSNTVKAISDNSELLKEIKETLLSGDYDAVTPEPKEEEEKEFKDIIETDGETETKDL